MSTNEEQVRLLTDKLGVLENESRRLLTALHWSTKVRMILFFSLLLFVLVSTFLFYRLYVDIKTNRFEQVQRIIRENPEEFSEPLTRQVMLLAEEQGPYVVEAFREQAQKDSQQYVQAFDTERATLIANLQTNLEAKLQESYATMLAEQEEMLKKEFPVLQDPDKLENIRNNMEKIYDKIGKRYYVDSLKEEMESIASKIDTFPPSQPKQDNIPLGEQVATELLELVRLMLVNTENYVVPPEEQAVSAQTPAPGQGDGPSEVAVEIEDNAPAKPPTPDEDSAKSTEEDKSGDQDKAIDEEKTLPKDKSDEEDKTKTPDDSDNN